jgi:hypothetical protein
MKHPLQHLVYATLLAMLTTPLTVWAQATAAPPISGVIGKLQSFNGSSLDVMTSSGVVHVAVKEPLTTYKQIPTDLSHITASSYVGVASTEQADGKQVAKQVFIFPAELSGAAEGSVLTDPRCNLSQQNDQRLGLSPCWIALTHDERDSPEGQRSHAFGSLSGRLPNDLRTAECPSHRSGTSKGHF